MQKRGQQNRMFIYIFSVIVLGMVMLFGYFVIRQFADLNEESKLIDFRTNLLAKFKSIKDGDVRLFNPEMPKNIKEVFFVDVKKIIEEHDSGGAGISAGLEARNPLIANSIRVQIDAHEVSENFFLINDKKQIEISEYIGKLDISGPHYFCSSVENGRLNLRIEGKGDGVKFGEFEKTEGFSSSKGAEITFEDLCIEGLKLVIPPKNGVTRGKIKMKLDPSKEGISDSISIDIDECNPSDACLNWNRADPNYPSDPILLMFPVSCSKSITFEAIASDHRTKLTFPKKSCSYDAAAKTEVATFELTMI